MSNTVVAVYDNYEDAQKARQELLQAGFSEKSVGLTTSGNNAQTSTNGDGSTLDSSTRTNDSSDSGIGNFFRSLFGMDDDVEHRNVYAESVRRGSHVLTAHPTSEQQADEGIRIMNAYSPVDVAERSAMWKSQGWTGYDDTAPSMSRDDIEKDRSSYAASSLDRQTNQLGEGDQADSTRIPVIREELEVGKRVVQRGGVRVFQRVSEQPVQETLNLREEHVVVERHPVNQQASAADLSAFKEGTIEVVEHAEEAVVSKTARVVEEVTVGKTVQERPQTVSDTVRRTDVDVQQLDGNTTSNRSSAMSSDYDQDYRTHWQSSYGNSGDRYEDYDNAYRYGTQMATSGQYSGRQWDELEPELRGNWESNGHQSTWEKVKDAVRYGAERVTNKR